MVSNNIHLKLDAQRYALSAHQLFGGFYYGRPYAMHIQMVSALVKHFIPLIPRHHQQIVFDAACCHAALDENVATYEELVRQITVLGADIVSACTPNNARSIADKYNSSFYDRVTRNHYAVFVTVCDRIADITYLSKSSPATCQRLMDEMVKFKISLYIKRYEALFDKLDEVAKMTLKSL